MKFLCDRCKTRYSIGDERVRGKILKIRCKNCANVITVREGMSDAEVAPETGAAPKRRQQVTQAITAQDQVAVAAATLAANGRNGSHEPAKAAGALGAAFADAVTKPPPALEEEWYVSIDGDQSGPFSLAEAQRWVAGKPFDAELHCWSEGFDDWLPVDKVSHFRGLRKKPAPLPAPPPLPRVGSGPSRAPQYAAAAPSGPAAVEEDPKPLFAATMASLEKAAASAPAPVPRLPSPLPSITPARATPPKGVPYTNGNGAVSAKGSGTASPSTPIRPGTPQGVVAKKKGFDVSENDARSKPFDDTAAEPRALGARDAGAIDKATALDSESQHHGSSPFKAPAQDAFNSLPRAPTPPPDEDDMEIGEVSRVVKLADIMKAGPKQTATRRSGSVAAVGAPNPMLSRTGSVPKLAAMPLAQAVDAPPSATGVGPIAELVPPPVVTHRRGFIALMIGALVLLGAAVVVVVFVMNKEDPDVTSLGAQYDIDTQRPDQVVRRPGDPIPVEPPVNPYLPPRKPQPYIRPPIKDVKPPDPPPGNSLKADEIEAMAGKYSTTTQSCWRRVQRGANGILLADVKKITVTMTIAPDGTVTGVALSDGHAQDDLGRCLITTMRTWKFRTSSGGDFRFVLHFG